MAFYLKYRPQKIDDLDLVSVREQLQKLVDSKNIPHALLFSGPKGTGKTSAARIIAKIVNCTAKTKNKPCNKCSQCISITDGNNIDVIEIDAASHRGIDDIRSLREAVKLASSGAHKKVYIIDEAHMLTTEASNALLKTLEEPPEHVMFILATTNPEKLIGTIRSRSTNIIYTKATKDEIMRSLKTTVSREKIKIDDGSLELIAKSSDGSFRDAEKILEQAMGGKKTVSQKAVKDLLNDSSSSSKKLLEFIIAKDLKAALNEIESFVNAGGIIPNLILDLESAVRYALLAKSGVQSEDIDGISFEGCTKLLELLFTANSQLSKTHIEQLPLELAMVKWCDAGEKNYPGTQEDESDEEDVAGPTSTRTSQNDQIRSGAPKSKIINPTKTIDGNPLSSQLWLRVLEELKPDHFSLEALLRSSRPLDFDGDSLTVGVFYQFHKERIEENQHRMVLEEVVERIIGKKVKIYCELTEPIKKIESPKEEVILTEPNEPLTDGDSSDIINVAKEIFGK